MLQNTYFCAPNPQSQAYIQYEGMNLYPMNLIYAPTSPSYFFLSGYQGDFMHKHFKKNAFEQTKQPNPCIQTQRSLSGSIQTHQKVKIQTNDSSSVERADGNKLIVVKTQEIECIQHSFFYKNVKMEAQKSQKINQEGDLKKKLKQQRVFYTRKGTQKPQKTGRSFWWNQIEEESQLDGIEMIKEFSKELIIYILKNQDSRGEILQSVKNDIAEMICKSLKKQRETIQQSLDHVSKILSTKFSKFKKTKEEMIKYVFRRIYNTKSKPEDITEISWKMAQKIHKRNSSTFKSMNMKFVETQFQNPIFAHLFSTFLDNFQQNLEKENDDRIDRLNFIVASAIITQDMSELKSYKKLPWNKAVVRSIQKLFGDLKEIQRNTPQTEVCMELLCTDEYREMYGGDSSLIKKRTQYQQGVIQSKVTYESVIFPKSELI